MGATSLQLENLDQKDNNNLLYPFQKASGIEVQVRFLVLSKFALACQHPKNGKGLEREIVQRIQESFRILLDQKPQHRKDIGRVPFDPAPRRNRGLRSRLIARLRDGLEMSCFAFQDLQ